MAGQRRWLRWLLGSLAVLVLLLAGLAGFTYWILDTPNGLRFALDQARRITDGAVTVGSADGRVLGDLDLRDVRYAAADGLLVTIRRVHLRYEWQALLARRLHAEVFDIDTLDVTPGPATAPVQPASKTRLPTRLPVDVVVDSMRLDGFKLHAAAPAAAVITTAPTPPSNPPTNPATSPASNLATAPSPAPVIAATPVPVPPASATAAGPPPDAGGTVPAVPPPFVIAHAELKGEWIGDRVTIDGLTTALPQTGPVRLQAKARMGSDRIDFQSLSLQGPGDITAKGTLGVDASVANDLTLTFEHLHWPLALEDGQPAQVDDITGSLHLAGPLSSYRFDAKSNAALQGHRATLETRGSGSLEAAHIDELRIDALALVPANAAPDTAANRPKAAAATSAAGAAASQPADATRSSSKTAAPSKPSSKTASKPASKPAVPDNGAITASGDVAWSPAIKADLQIVLEHIDPALFAPDVPGDLNGRLDTHTTLTGERPDIVFTADFEESTLRGRPFSLKVDGSTDTQRATLKMLLLQAGAGRVQAKGDVAWMPNLAVNLDAEIAKLDPALVLPDWPGNLNGTIKATTLKAPKSPTAFDARISHSTLRGYPLNLDAQATLTGKVVVVQQLKLESGVSALSLSGQVTPPFDLAGRFDSTDLSSLYPKVSGRAAFDFKLQGLLDQPHLVTSGSASAIKLGEQTVAKVLWTADVDPKVDSKIGITVSDADVGLHIGKLSLNASGLEVYHKLDLSLETERGNARLTVQGGFDRKRLEWGGELNALGLAPSGLPAWTLEKGAGILIGQKRRSLEPACLKSSDGRACFTLEQNVLNDGTRVGWNIDHLLMAAFQPFLPPRDKLSGTIDGEGHVNFTGGDIAEAKAALDLHDARLEVPDAPPLVLRTGTLRADQTDGRLHGVLDLRAEQGSVSADVSAAPGAQLSERALGGSIGIDFPSLAFLEPLLPQLHALDGKLAGKLALGGTPKRPTFGGQVAITDAHAKVVAAGIEVRDLQFRIASDGQGPLNVDGSLKSGDGTLKVSGRIDPFATPLNADIHIDGEDFQALGTAQARAWISPKLELVRDAKGLTLTGDLVVPHAEITPKGLGGGGIDPSEDQVLVGVEVQPQEETLPIFANIRLVLGNKVSIEGFGLKTRIEGAVAITQEPKRGALGNGELRLIDGHYKAYGQDLNIETGRLLFTGGPVTTPAVDLYATRKPREDIVVGVRVRGTLARPELTLQSTPTLPREQQLSWLILGRSLETSSAQERTTVSSAALSLGLGGGDYLAGLIGKKVGLDEVSVGAAPVGGSDVIGRADTIAGSQTGSSANATTQAAQLTLGKYLTPRLFVSYGMSLFQQGYSVRLLYTLGRGFKLSTETGTTSGGDIIYQTDRGKRKTPPANATPATSAEPNPSAPLKAIEDAPPIETPAEKARDKN